MIIFDYNGQDISELKERSGQTVTVVKALTNDEADLEETGPMSRIKFNDGYEHDAFDDELTH